MNKEQTLVYLAAIAKEGHFPETALIQLPGGERITA